MIVKHDTKNSLWNCNILNRCCDLKCIAIEKNVFHIVGDRFSEEFLSVSPLGPETPVLTPKNKMKNLVPNWFKNFCGIQLRKWANDTGDHNFETKKSLPLPVFNIIYLLLILKGYNRLKHNLNFNCFHCSFLKPKNMSWKTNFIMKIKEKSWNFAGTTFF